MRKKVKVVYTDYKLFQFIFIPSVNFKIKMKPLPKKQFLPSYFHGFLVLFAKNQEYVYMYISLVKLQKAFNSIHFVQS